MWTVVGVHITARELQLLVQSNCTVLFVFIIAGRLKAIVENLCLRFYFRFNGICAIFGAD
jgi:hypothetical protein